MKFPPHKTVPTQKLIPYALNSRTHSDAQIDQIAASIKEFGFLNPIIVDGENGIIAGHGRVMAAKKLGMTELPVIQADHLSDAQRKAYVIADNKLALNAGWDDDFLKSEIETLHDLDFDEMLLGFNEQELAVLFLEKQEGKTNPEDEWEDMPEFDNETSTSFRSVHVHFDTPDDVAEFFKIIGQTDTGRTKSISFPEKKARRDIESERYI